MRSHLNELTRLSHEFGRNDFVKGGGGNSSVKNANTLWIKPSGTTMATIENEDFVVLDRKAIDRLKTVDPSVPESTRETIVLDIMTTANTSPEKGRPSVEAPVHNLFEATYVIHTHPTIVNGMTCGKAGEAMCRDLFPDAVWLDYIDPGFTLFQAMETILNQYRDDHGRDPECVFMKNHGVLVAADTPDEVRRNYQHIMQTLTDCYDQDMNQAHRQFSCKPLDYDATEADLVSQLGDVNGFSFVSVHSPFPLAKGPITPDHIVYMKALLFEGVVTQENLECFVDVNGYFPKIIISPIAIYVLGQSSRDAMLALEIVQDASQIMQLARTFGSIDYMTERATHFIENWEVEAYRRRQALNHT